MKLYQLIQAFEFDEVFPEVNNMFPNANLHRDVYEKAFSMLQELKPTLSKKTIRYELMDDPNTNGMYVGADDNSFYTTWDVIIGKEIKKGKGVDLNDLEIVANCLLNIILIGKHPQSVEKDFQKLRK